MSAVGFDVIESLAALETGWDGYSGQPIGPLAINVVRYLAVVPTSDGGVQIEWHANGWDVEIAVSADGEPETFSMSRAPAR